GDTHAEVRFAVDPAVTRQLVQRAAEQRVTVGTLLQAAWAMLLSRYSGEAGVVFGVTVSGRDIGLPDIDGMVGLLINTLPLRLRIEDCALFPWLRSVQTQHQLNAQYAYTRLVDIHRCSSMRPGEQLFDSILVLENYPWRVDVPNATSEALRVTDMRAVDRT